VSNSVHIFKLEYNILALYKISIYCNNFKIEKGIDMFLEEMIFVPPKVNTVF